MSFAFRSYLKTTVACAAIALVALLITFPAVHWLPAFVGASLAALSLLVALVAATFAGAGALVLGRYKRGERGERDLFLELNESRDARAIKSAAVPRTTRLRRWLARRLLEHDFLVGDLVEIRTWAEIRATLDAQGCLEQLPFLPEMLAMCGQRARVFRCAHRLFDYRKTRRMRHMEGGVLLVGMVCDGSSHGGCEAACHTIWKAAWLRRVDAAGVPAAASPSEPVEGAVLQFGVRAPRYTCQLTQLHAASQPVGAWSATNFLRPLIAGNVTPAAFAVGWLTHLFNELQHQRQGIGFPEFEPTVEGAIGREETRLLPGDPVVVRSSSEIRATLSDQLEHRGLGFDTDMLKHCGRQCRVQAEVKKLIDIVTGEMRTMKTPAYVLRDVHFSGERQLFNAQYEPLFWRGAWLQRDGA